MEHDLRKFNISAGILQLNLSSLTSADLFTLTIKIQYVDI
jgi:hypothetical protein